MDVFDPQRDSQSTVTISDPRNRLGHFEIKRNRTDQSNTFLARSITVKQPGEYLSSVNELEEAQIDSAGSRAPVVARHFLLTTRVTKKYGHAYTHVRVIRSTPNGKSVRVKIDVGRYRVKVGQRFVAVSSKGEILVLGATDKESGYRVRSCLLSGAEEQLACRLGRVETSQPDDAEVITMEDPSESVTQTERVTRKALWGKAQWYTTQTYEVNMSGMPQPCSPAGCGFKLGGKDINWLPPTEMRLERGTYTKVGVPYAQRRGNPKAEPAPGKSFYFPKDDSGAYIIRHRETRDGKLMVYSFGDVKNADEIITNDATPILGIDCSALLSQFWNISPPVSTDRFVEYANDGTNNIRRLPEIRFLRMNDAFLIRTKNLNHISLFRETRTYSPSDASEAILVVESSSSCGGACWTFYDESFFHGWALIRTSAEPLRLKWKKKRGIDFPTITTDKGEWGRRFLLPEGS
jgi:hypothetical protein